LATARRYRCTAPARRRRGSGLQRHSSSSAPPPSNGLVALSHSSAPPPQARLAVPPLLLAPWWGARARSEGGSGEELRVDEDCAEEVNEEPREDRCCRGCGGCIAGHRRGCITGHRRGRGLAVITDVSLLSSARELPCRQGLGATIPHGAAGPRQQRPCPARWFRPRAQPAGERERERLEPRAGSSTHWSERERERDRRESNEEENGIGKKSNKWVLRVRKSRG